MSSEGYEDFKYLSGITILGSEINVPISIKGTDITLPISIDAQTITLDVNITNATVDVNIVNATLDVNIVNTKINVDATITGSEITLDVNITNTQIHVVVDNTVLDVNITNSELNVKVTNSVLTIQGDVNITNATLDVNVVNSELNVNVGTFPFEKAWENILENPDFEDGTTSRWFTQAGVTISATTEKAFGGSYSMKIVSDGTSGNVITSQFIFVQPGQKILFSGWVYREANVDIFRVGLWQHGYDGGWVELQTVDLSDIPSNSWQAFKVIFEIPDGVAKVRVGFTVRNTDGVSAVYIDSLYIPKTLVVGHSTEIPINMNIASQSVDIDVNIKAQEVTLNVQVEGTASVSIDNATVYLNVQQERKGFGWVYIGDNSASGNLAYYKYYYLILWHGARAFIRSLSIGVKNSDTANDKTLIVKFYLWHNTAPLYKTTITVEAGFDGTKTIYPLIYWNYDMLIVEIENPDTTNVGIYYTPGVTSNYYAFSNTQFNYTISSDLHIQVELRIADAGSIPVSGTVNTIQIPNRATYGSFEQITVPSGKDRIVFSVEGMGVVRFIMIHANGNNAFKVILYADNEGVFTTDIMINERNVWKSYNSTFGFRLVRSDYDTTDWVLAWEIPIEFRQNFFIVIDNILGTGDVEASGRVVYSLLS